MKAEGAELEPRSEQNGPDAPEQGHEPAIPVDEAASAESTKMPGQGPDTDLQGFGTPPQEWGPPPQEWPEGQREGGWAEAGEHAPTGWGAQAQQGSWNQQPWQTQQPTKPKRGLAMVIIAALVGAAIGVAGYRFTGVQAPGGGRVDQLLPEPKKDSKPRPAPGSVAAIVEQIAPSIVAIRTESVARDFFFQPVPQQGAGTGIILSDDGHVLTNAHVVSGARSIKVIMADGKEHSAAVVGADGATDLAVLKVDATGLKPAPLGDSDMLNVGDRVIAVGHALALPGGPTVTEGIVSALDRSIREPNGAFLEDLIQTDAAINPGNSGGALLNSQGEVVGINTAVAGQAQNIGFAIAITSARTIVNELTSQGKVSRAFLGVSMTEVNDQIAEQQELDVKEGALVVQTVEGSPAEQSGIVPGDVIIELDGKPVKGPDDVRKILSTKKPGETVEIRLARGKQRVNAMAVLSEPIDQ